jgi:hypothetical protein
MHPDAAGMRIRSIGRVNLQLGEALRLEMTNDGDDRVRLQYYIVTDPGPWALWLTCSTDEVADAEATLQALMPPLADA